MQVLMPSKRNQSTKTYMRAIIAKLIAKTNLTCEISSILKSSYIFRSYLYSEAVLPYGFRIETSFHTTGLLVKRRKRGLLAGNTSCPCPNNPGFYLYHCIGQQLLNCIMVFQTFQSSLCCLAQVPFLLNASVMQLQVLHCSFSTSHTFTCTQQELSY